MSQSAETESRAESKVENKVENKVWWHVSVDGWAVALALVLALLVWIGAIKHVPW